MTFGKTLVVTVIVDYPFRTRAYAFFTNCGYQICEQTQNKWKLSGLEVIKEKLTRRSFMIDIITRMPQGINNINSIQTNVCGVMDFLLIWHYIMRVISSGSPVLPWRENQITLPRNNRTLNTVQNILNIFSAAYLLFYVSQTDLNQAWNAKCTTNYRNWETFIKNEYFSDKSSGMLWKSEPS